MLCTFALVSVFTESNGIIEEAKDKALDFISFMSVTGSWIICLNSLDACM